MRFIMRCYAHKHTHTHKHKHKHAGFKGKERGAMKWSRKMAKKWEENSKKYPSIHVFKTKKSPNEKETFLLYYPWYGSKYGVTMCCESMPWEMRDESEWKWVFHALRSFFLTYAGVDKIYHRTQSLSHVLACALTLFIFKCMDVCE